MLKIRSIAEATSEREAAAVPISNQDYLVQQCQIYSEELMKQAAKNRDLTDTVNGLVDKVNVLAGLVGAPPHDSTVPSLCIAVQDLAQRRKDGLDDSANGSPNLQESPVTGCARGTVGQDDPNPELIRQLGPLEVAFAQNIHSQHASAKAHQAQLQDILLSKRMQETERNVGDLEHHIANVARHCEPQALHRTVMQALHGELKNV